MQVNRTSKGSSTVKLCNNCKCNDPPWPGPTHCYICSKQPPKYYIAHMYSSTGKLQLDIKLCFGCVVDFLKANK